MNRTNSNALIKTVWLYGCVVWKLLIYIYIYIFYKRPFFALNCLIASAAAQDSQILVASKGHHGVWREQITLQRGYGTFSTRQKITEKYDKKAE